MFDRLLGFTDWDEHGYCFPRYETIAAGKRSAKPVSRRAVADSLKRLDKNGYIISKQYRWRGFQATNRYTFPLLVPECNSKCSHECLSPDFVDASTRQLLRLATLPRHRVATSTSLSAALALITSLTPRDEAQAALALHIACLHAASLEVLARMMETVSERRLIPMVAAAAKLERAFQCAIDNYYRMQRGATQVVRIERVEVQPGAQAIVGVVPRK